MSQYEALNAGNKIDGYFLPRPNESQLATFERAKVECAANLQRSLQNVEALTFEAFKAQGFQK